MTVRTGVYHPHLDGSIREEHEGLSWNCRIRFSDIRWQTLAEAV